MSVKDRIKLFISDQMLTISAFETSIMASNGYVNSISRSIGLDKLEVLIEKYPNLNIKWLLTGKGEMISGVNSISDPGVKYSAPCPGCLEKEKRITELEGYIDSLKENVTFLKKEISAIEKGSAPPNTPYSQTG
ncbi:MAG: hypothetical protein WCR72_14345 [Bacteroidota bacterium]